MRIYARVKGHVQGVGFRYFVVQHAHRLNLTGWVKNCSNGDVECEAQGTNSALDDFKAKLKDGHTWARVDTIHVEDIQDQQEEDNCHQALNAPTASKVWTPSHSISGKSVNTPASTQRILKH